jgi:hypothetical protein
LDRKNADAFWRLCDDLKQTVAKDDARGGGESCMTVTVLQRVAMVCHQVWVDLQSSIVALHSLRDEALLDQSTGHVVVGICEGWLQSQRGLQART